MSGIPHRRVLQEQLQHELEEAVSKRQKPAAHADEPALAKKPKRTDANAKVCS